MNNYQNGKIYKIINSDNENVYIGSTIQKLYERMGGHRRNAIKLNKPSKLYNHMRDIGVEKFKIILIGTSPCSNKEELEKKEFEEMKRHDTKLLLNENIYYKKHSEEHSKKVGESQQLDKSSRWKYGSIFKRSGKSADGYTFEVWCFSYITPERKAKRYQFSIQKYGDVEAKNKALKKQSDIFPEVNN
jgi:hypothetical protein